MQEGSNLGLAGDAASEDHLSCSGQCWGEGEKRERKGRMGERERKSGRKEMGTHTHTHTHLLSPNAGKAHGNVVCQQPFILDCISQFS